MYLLKILFILFALLHLAITSFAGDLNPSQAPAPTMKTLDEVEPRIPIKSLPTTITNPGSYYLASNMVVASSDGIVLGCDHVTIDLMGYTISGPGGNTGINLNGRQDIEIRNGSIHGFGLGISEDSELTSGLGVRIFGLRVSSCSQGIQLYSISSLVKDCHAYNNGTGIRVGEGSVVTNCVVYSNNSSWGIAMEGPNDGDKRSGRITNNLVYGNAGPGIVNNNRGVGISGNTVIDNNQVNSAENGGIVVQGSSCIIEDNNITNNYQNGIVIGSSGNVIEGNHIDGSTNGIHFNSDNGNYFNRNMLHNTTTNFSNVGTNTDGGDNVGF